MSFTPTSLRVYRIFLPSVPLSFCFLFRLFTKAMMSVCDSLKACIRMNSKLTDFFQFPRGIRQGYIVRPTLFSLIITEKIFADGNTIFNYT